MQIDPAWILCLASWPAISSTFSCAFLVSCSACWKSSDHQADPNAHSGGMNGAPASRA